MYIQRCNHSSQSSPSMFRVANGGPAAAHVWRECCGFWEPGHRGPELGPTASMKQKDVVMMSPLLGVVQKPYPQNTGDTLLKIPSNGFPSANVIISSIKYTFISLRLFGNWLGLPYVLYKVVWMISVSSKQKCEWDFCQTLTFKCPSDLALE